MPWYRLTPPQPHVSCRERNLPNILDHDPDDPRWGLSVNIPDRIAPGAVWECPVGSCRRRWKLHQRSNDGHPPDPVRASNTTVLKGPDGSTWWDDGRAPWWERGKRTTRIFIG